MRHPSLKRTLIAAVFSLVVASVLLVGTAPVNAQSKPNSQGIPQQIAALERQVRALSDGLARLTPGAGGGTVLRVVDANGVEVGPLIMPSYVVRKIGESWVLFNVGPGGFTQSTTDIAADGCGEGSKHYMQDYGELLKWGVVANGIGYYASGPPQLVTVAAWYRVFADGGSVCEPITGDKSIMPSLSEVGTFDLSVFRPPFAVRYDQ